MSEEETSEESLQSRRVRQERQRGVGELIEPYELRCSKVSLAKAKHKDVIHDREQNLVT